MHDNNLFQGLWGGNETTYSAIIAQTMFLLPEFNSFIKEKCDIPNDAEMTKIVTEEVLASDDRIDIFAQYDDRETSYILGIENKKWAALQPNQLQRYADSLQKRAQEGTKGRLLFLGPSRYRLSETDKPKSEKVPMKQINYQEMIDFFKSYSPSSDFATAYCKHLIEYLEVLEIKAITQEELDSIAAVPLIDSFTTKTRTILEDIRDKEIDGKIEDQKNNYRLFPRKSGPFPVYIGFRFSSDWYCDAPLLNNRPECIIYVKDIWEEKEAAHYNSELAGIFPALKEEISNLGASNDIQFFERKKQDECRIMIRRSLNELVNEDIGVATAWFKNVLEKLESNLPKS